MNAGMRTSLRAAPPPAEAAGAPTGASGCTTCGGMTKPAAPPALSAAVKKMISGLSRGQQEAVLKSPTLRRGLQTLADRGWKVEYAKDGGGYADRTTKTIHLADDYANVAVLAHEAGHALYTLPTPSVGMFIKAKDDYIHARVDQNLADEGQAQFSLGAVRREVLASTGDDIAALGNFTSADEAVYNQYVTGKLTQDQAADRLGERFRELTTSTTGEKYPVQYGKAAEAEWNAQASNLGRWRTDLSTWWNE